MTDERDLEALAQLDPARIEEALSSSGWVLPIPNEFKSRYRADLDADRRGFNRWTIALFTLIFDLFWLAQFKSAPEIVPLSGALRFGLMTPFAAIFIVLDRRDRLGRWYEPLLFALALAPGLITAQICIVTTSLNTMSDVRAIPLILLTTGMLWRMTLPTMVANALISSGVFIASMFASPVVPHAELPSVILTDISIATAVIFFKLQLERRDRRVFLLSTSERIRRAALTALNRGLKQESQTDALTGVANRRCFDETLSSLWQACRQTRDSLALIMLDVDHFKKFNDYYGHQGGDECLRRVAAAAGLQVRDCDLIARYGGEEFAIILPRTEIAAAANVAERVRGAVSGMALPHQGIGPSGRLSVSLGVACVFPAEPQGARQLIEMADEALYSAKRNGRDRVIVAGEEHADADHEQVVLASP